MDIHYQSNLDNLTSDQLGGFFVDWPNAPSRDAHYRILEGSDHLVLARSDGGKVVGWISAISDGVSCAYIPHLAVLPEYQGNGIGSELVRRLLKDLEGLYMIDLTCDDELVSFYKRLGFKTCNAMIIRNYSRQDCRS